MIVAKEYGIQTGQTGLYIIPFGRGKMFMTKQKMKLWLWAVK